MNSFKRREGARVANLFATVEAAHVALNNRGSCILCLRYVREQW